MEIVRAEPVVVQIDKCKREDFRRIAETLITGQHQNSLAFSNNKSNTPINKTDQLIINDPFRSRFNYLKSLN